MKKIFLVCFLLSSITMADTLDFQCHYRYINPETLKTEHLPMTFFLRPNGTRYVLMNGTNTDVFTAPIDQDQSLSAVKGLKESFAENPNDPYLQKNLEKFGKDIEKITLKTKSGILYKVGECDDDCALAVLTRYLDKKGKTIRISGVLGWGGFGMCK